MGSCLSSRQNIEGMQSGDNNIIPFNNIGLGHFSYLVVSKDKECAIIDPIFLIDDYVKEIESGKLLLKFIFLTHIQSEFIMGHNRLKEKYPQAKIFLAQNNQIKNCEYEVATDGQIHKFGSSSTFKVFATPGHTEESVTYQLTGGDGKLCLFTGDTLLTFNEGAPDYFFALSFNDVQKYSQKLYVSLQNIFKLDENSIVFPGKHPKTAPKNVDKPDRIGDTLKDVKERVFPNLKDEKEFVQKITKLPIPPSFPCQNQVSYANNIIKFDFESAKKNSFFPLSPKEVQSYIQSKKAIVFDTRLIDQFTSKFIAGTYSYSFAFKNWEQTISKVFNGNLNFIIIALDDKAVEETYNRMIQIGFHNVLGYLKGGVDAWEKEIGQNIVSSNNVPIKQFVEKKMYQNQNAIVVDARNPPERNVVNYTTSQNVNVFEFEKQFKPETVRLDKNKDIYIYCRTGCRSLCLLSMLVKFGFDPKRLYNLDGGILKMKDEPELANLITKQA